MVNKIDNFEKEQDALVFYQLGIGVPYPISSVNLLGIGDMLDELCALLPQSALEQEDAEVISVAVVGRPNVGKSSLVNRILGEERVMVSDIAGRRATRLIRLLKRRGANSGLSIRRGFAARQKFPAVRWNATA